MPVNIRTNRSQGKWHQVKMEQNIETQKKKRLLDKNGRRRTASICKKNNFIIK